MFKKTMLVVAVTSLFSLNAMAITVTTTDDPTTLTNTILGSGITVIGIPSYSGTGQSGTFVDDTVFGLGSGIVLTTGDAQDAAGETNTSDGLSVNTTSPGDADLSGLIGGLSTNDSAILEFQFETTGGDLFFNWVFASEEYNEYVGSQYNDVFGFFVDGVNIALAPDGQVAAINSINCGDPYAGVGPNCSSYNNNDPNDPGATIATEYDGFTDVLTAEVLGLGAGIHTIKIAIADASDSILDSAVFIQAGSFSDTPPNGDVPEPGILALLGLGLAGMTFARRRKHS